VQNILSFIYKILSQFVKPPSDTLIRYSFSYILIPKENNLKKNKKKTKYILHYLPSGVHERVILENHQVIFYFAITSFDISGIHFFSFWIVIDYDLK
jgi:hypothetical protein